MAPLRAGKASCIALCGIALALSLMALPASGQGDCTAAGQHAALLQLYNAASGVAWPNQALWNSSTPCTDTLTPRTDDKRKTPRSVQLPSHCCWEGIACCVLPDDDTGWLECLHGRCACDVGNVTDIFLGRNGLTGELGVVLSRSTLGALSCNLRQVFMGGNELYGTLPEYLSELPQLAVLSLGSNFLEGTIPASFTSLTRLQELDLSSNGLTGGVPAGLCGGAERLSPLRDLTLSNNNLTGRLQVTDCESLINLDVQNNNLEGPLPDLASYQQLHILRLGNNYFNGTIPQPPFDLRLLAVFDISRNLLTGPLPDLVGNGSQLTIVRMYGNSLTGTLPSNIFTLGTLGGLWMYNNNLTGTLPENIGDARGLNLLLLQQNYLYGTIPPSMASLACPDCAQSVDLSLNQLSCCGMDYVLGQGYRYFDYTRPLLPSFLAFANDSAKPVWDDTNQDFTNMRCPSLVAALAPNATAEEPALLNHSNWRILEATTSMAGLRALGNSSSATSAAAGSATLNWKIDPEYFLYTGCFCIDGFREVWVEHTDGEPSMGRRLTCVPVKTPWVQRYPWVVVLIVLGGLLVAAWLTYLSCYRRGKRAAILQNYYNLRKRVKGEPLGGQVSVVVTDIEGYSDLMKQSPELMTKALNLHNGLIRKARWSNFGYTVEQEGDSYVLVFYEALDAVIFCLQTQLALNRQTWPEGLFVVEARDAPSRRRTPGPGLLNAISMMTNNLTHSLFGNRTSGQPVSFSSNPPHQTGISDDRSLSIAAMPSSLRAAGMSTDGIRPEGFRPDSRQSSTMAIGREPSTVGTPRAASAPGGGGGLSLGFFHRHHALFNGMRVRMGIATGLLPPGQMSKGSAVLDLAKMVSDAANGGQIMMDEATFADIKERLEELGAVDHNGMNFKKLNAIQPPWYSCLKRKSARNPDEALILDMGEYTHCPGSKRLPLFSVDASTAPATPGAGGAPPPGQRSKGPERLRLYQVAPPALVGRAKAFGNKVTLKDEWVCSDQPYFSAPGTLDAPLGNVDGPVLLPPITMVFAIVENGKAFSAKFRRDARRVHDLIAACIRACLRCCGAGAAPGGAAGAISAAAVAAAAALQASDLTVGAGGARGGGGYLCRMQDGDLKYMVAFATPQAAVEWSLLLQDVLMYAEWPEPALKFWREEYDEQGRMVFRGPRMKIGVCEGSPRSVIPDHIGRADYHGASINQAARFMDAAAHGGMVALEASLALKVMAEWQAAEAGGGEAGLAVVAEMSPDAQTGTAGAASGAAAGTAAAAAAEVSGSSSGRLLSINQPGGSRMPSVREGDGGEEMSPHAAARAAKRRYGGGGERRGPPAPWEDDAPAAVGGGFASSPAASATTPGGGAIELSPVAALMLRPRGSTGSGASASTGLSGRSDPLPRLLVGSGPQAYSVSHGHSPSHSARVAPEPVAALLRDNPVAVLGSPEDERERASGGGGGGVPLEGATAAGAGPSSGSGFRLVPDRHQPLWPKHSVELWPQARGDANEDAPTPSTHVERRSWGERLQVEMQEVAAAAAARAAAAAEAEAEEGDGSSARMPRRNRSLRTTATVVLREREPEAGEADAVSAAAEARTSSGDGDGLIPPLGPSAVAEGVEGGGTSDAAALLTPTSVHLELAPSDTDASNAAGAGPSAGGVVDAAAFAAQSQSGCEPLLVNAGSDPSMSSLARDEGAAPLSPTSPFSVKNLGGMLPVPPSMHHLVQTPTNGNGAARPPALQPVSSPALSDEPSCTSVDGEGGGTTLPGGEITVSGGTAAGGGGGGSAPDLLSLAASPRASPRTTPQKRVMWQGERLSPAAPASSSVTLPSPQAAQPGQPITLMPPVGRAVGPRQSAPISPSVSARSPSQPGFTLGAYQPPMMLSNAHRAYSAGAANTAIAAAAAAVTGSTGGAALAATPHAVTTSGGGATAAAAATTRTASGVIPGSGPSNSSVRSPRPPSLPPLALPTDRERDAALAAERAAAEESRKIQVDGPADARYRVCVAAHRIGVFRFKGSPEDLVMAHIVLEHLAGRRFPADAPKLRIGS
ncbi:hypothetical protein GPECTOR_32g423 [Gonium pectorale]|uniref:Guanylate cyclase domain-containing protein n=1 Tax=Gonium pectorale TaxID=33097 RepID=A0A150GD76_GONPE|nr:hypothetical protein GPECTOR_32g423 [Gonium pectorale]|eukprot:KXZ47811.1 hypothetical protein GPECTOR_32g423 [Gonium pectorale]